MPAPQRRQQAECAGRAALARRLDPEETDSAVLTHITLHITHITHITHSGAMTNSCHRSQVGNRSTTIRSAVLIKFQMAYSILPKPAKSVVTDISKKLGPFENCVARCPRRQGVLNAWRRCHIATGGLVSHTGKRSRRWKAAGAASVAILLLSVLLDLVTSELSSNGGALVKFIREHLVWCFAGILLVTAVLTLWLVRRQEMGPVEEDEALSTAESVRVEQRGNSGNVSAVGGIAFTNVVGDVTITTASL
ncbi:hypothetical protein ACFQX7_30220, partial [Luedemannella flava]